MTAPTLTRSDPRAHPGMTPELASRIVDGVLLTFASGRVDLILQGFTEDAELRFGPAAVLRGRTRIRAFLEHRFAERVDQRLEKRLRAVEGDALVVDWCDRWTDTRTGRVMRSEGTEVWTLRDGLLRTWEVDPRT
ncbi:nuclear transport factor 2 family protein [Pseudonocardia sp. WMMC193]|uniref:nuclear transport factor 2 family protein n=1 Tax=Pseudonocardia sp. WMMC193 TaxID=2911965 RepID=UPI001F31B08A|nr:nuclear transport factor 2 family protein [Pseudonocardia sp. WMMC193]MCF7551533.1 nuclear transport factor 2 family protein [Pseudonocardia sp. WMMC193]